MVATFDGKQASEEIDRRMGDIINRIENIKAPINEIRAYLESQYSLAFQEQGRGEEWKPRSVPNVAGIIKDLKDGGQAKERRFFSEQTLIDTGRLRNSGATRVQGNTIFWGTNVPYGATHQFGDSVTIDNPIPQMLKAGNRRVQNELNKIAKRGFEDTARALQNQKQFTLEIPARPFVEILEEDIDAIVDILSSHIVEEE